MPKEHTIDASGVSLGRVASRTAWLLSGKGEIGWVPHAPPPIVVRITNASKVAMSEKKLRRPRYKRFSGYPGGLHHRTAADIITTKGYAELIRHAIYGMLPKNKLRSKLMKWVIITG